VSERSHTKKRSVRIGKQKTSLAMEEEFWQGLKEIARDRELPLSNLLADINKQRTHANMSSEIRLFVLDYYRRLTEAQSGPKDNH
jgi:predicted DNA-binding ribbon-helix-helix protein